MAEHRFTLRGLLRAGAGVALAPAIVGRATAVPMALRLSTSQANDPKYANGRVYYDFLVRHLADNKLDDQLQVKFFPDNQLGQEIDVANSVKLGVVDLMVTGTPIWTNLVPNLGLMDLGYLFQSYQQQTRALDAGVGKQLEQMLLTHANTRIVGWAYDFGARCLLSKTEVTGPADLAGKKIRTLPNPVITECLRLMGAAATPLAFGEVYTVLQAGVLDGLEHNPPTIIASKLYETAKHFTRTEHIHTALGTFLSEATFKRMPQALRDPFLDACGKAAIDTRVRALAAEGEATEVLKQQGVTINPCDREAFRRRVLPQTEAFMKARPETKPIIEMIQATSA